jgi:hypothetical protein
MPTASQFSLFVAVVVITVAVELHDCIGLQLFSNSVVASTVSLQS